jgi:hypothetical protein
VPEIIHASQAARHTEPDPTVLDKMGLKKSIRVYKAARLFY